MSIAELRDMLLSVYNLTIRRFFPAYCRRKVDLQEIPPRPPHGVKVRVVKEYASQYGLKTMIETGTYNGDMVDACKDIFNRIISIELGEDLYRKAKDKFSQYRHISIIHGDSSKLLPGLLANIDAPCLFFLDAHFSGGNTVQGECETPIMQELVSIFRHDVENHIILIDDACDFVGVEGYPTMEELKSFVLNHKPSWNFEVKEEIIRLHK